jgi:peptidoglycan L-alanyl-D-glutamate endopeptidase CwlK
MLSERDLQRLHGVRAELRDVANLAAQRIPHEMPGVTMIITEGLRSVARQKQLYAAGASKTMASNHITGRAFDFGLIVGKSARWDWPLFMQAGQIIKACAEDLGVRIVWGGDFKSFKDGPHVELAKDWA